MDPLKPKTGASDFFVHLGAVVVFYGAVVALFTLLFSIIEVAFPPVALQYYSYPSISFPVASLIVLFPVFVLLSWIAHRSYATDALKKNLPVRKWLTYLTLFLAGGIAAVDLITVIYYFLDGQNFTTAFLLKVLSVLVVAGVTFGYYLRDMNDQIMPAERKVWSGVALLIIVASIVWGFMVIGSPATQRTLRYDAQRVMDMQQIQGQILSYWQAKEVLPQNLNQLQDSLSYYGIPVDPETSKAYEYKASGARSFELCANFGLDQKVTLATPSVAGSDNWSYKKGRYCFERTIDPELYPPIKR